MGIFGRNDDYSFGMGSWALSSESDPRWNCSGRGQIISAWSGMPEEARHALKNLRKRYGKKNQPKDLMIHCYKD